MTDRTTDYTEGNQTPDAGVDLGGVNCLKFAPGYEGKYALTPPDAAVLAPWVTVQLSGTDFEIKVGNQSSKTAHAAGEQNNGHPHAAITSMECGLSNGSQAKIEIVDEMGGSFTTLFQRGVVKTMEDVSDACYVLVKFGWIGLDCNNNPIIMNQDWTLHYLLLNLDVNIGDGKIKYVLNCVDMMSLSNVTPKTVNYPNMSCKAAIAKFLDDDEPKMNVAFLTKSTNKGPPQEWKFQKSGNKQANEDGDGGSDGAGDVVDRQTNNDTKLAVIHRWLAPYLTENQRGIAPTYDPLNPTPTMILWEGEDDPSVLKAQGGDFNRIVEGVFVVNGGKCSNVISFSPNINFISSYVNAFSGGAPGGPGSSSETTKIPQGVGLKADGTEPKTEVGAQAGGPVTNQSIQHGGRDQGKLDGQAQVAHAAANKVYETTKAIEAELKIIGNPSREFVDIQRIRGSYVSIIYINPFTIDKDTTSNSEDNLCGDWLCRPQINDVLTNEYWMVKGVTHSIRDGKYVTTLSLYLAGPGIDLQAGANIGNDPKAATAGTGPGGTGTGTGN